MFLFSFAALPNVFAISGCIQMLSSYAAARIAQCLMPPHFQPLMMNTNPHILTIGLT